MHAQPPRINLTHPDRHCAARLGPRIQAFASQPGEHAVGSVLIELVGQRRQRPAARSAERDLPHQMPGQLLGQDNARDSQDFRRRVPGGNPVGIIGRGQLSRHRRL
jgi:hypothetical protein